MGYKLYSGSKLIKKIYYEGKAIKKVWSGGKIVWQADPYDPGTVIFYQTGPNTFETDLEAGVYDLIIAGGGGQE